ncbi:unnamed protein product, partial [Iphiclides podalirius]
MSEVARERARSRESASAARSGHELSPQLIPGSRRRASQTILLNGHVTPGEGSTREHKQNTTAHAYIGRVTSAPVSCELGTLRVHGCVCAGRWALRELGASRWTEQVRQRRWERSGVH